MNSVVRQLLEQDTDVVMVDTGDSYQGICSYFNGVYISYSKEKPISMNPFKVTKEEYTENFGEKKNFLKSLIFQIYKGDKETSKIEDSIIDQVLGEYYEEYFHPFKKFTKKQREEEYRKLLLSYKMNNEFEKISYSMEDVDSLMNQDPEKLKKNSMLMLPSEKAKIDIVLKCQKLLAVIDNDASTKTEKEKAEKALQKQIEELHENKGIVEIEKKINLIEAQKQRLKVRSLSFNSFYEFALERIPQITARKKVTFDIYAFSTILEKFYKGGEFQDTLNSDLDVNLFEEKFIVFEIDKIKDDKVLFPIVVLIIMDVFIQKMRIKKGRKALIIEEAWKAIASPTMAEYIKYLYKTVRKFHGIAGVVTQEIQDVIDSPIVKEAIINNSDIKILLDQTKFKDRYDEISKILGLTPIQKQQIFTINALQNKDGRNYFKEVWIARGLYSDVYGVEEPPQCYWAYTTERAEKEALKIYLDHYGNIEDAITHIVMDNKASNVTKYLDFANMVNAHKNVMSLWNV